MESRTLLATSAATATGGAVQLTNFVDVTKQGNAISPTVVVNPYNSQDVVAVWGVDLSSITPEPTPTTAIIEGDYSTNGGLSWSSFNPMDPILDAATIDSTPPTAYTQVTDPSVAFDSQGNVYVVALQTSGATDGAITLSKFSFSGGTLAPVNFPRSGNFAPYPQGPYPFASANETIVYQWLSSSDAAYSPALAVDSGTYPNDNPLNPNPPAGVPNDPYANNVYVAWASGDIHPANTNVDLPYNPNRIWEVVSTDGANSFSGETIANTGPANGNIGPQDDSHPQLVIDQQNGSGQVTVGWEDFGSGATASPHPFSNIVTNSVTAGDSYGVPGQTGPIAPGLAPPSGSVDTPVTTPFTATTSGLPSNITGLTVTVDIVHPSMTNIELVLQAPNNGPSITLLVNQTNAAGTANNGIGISGANLGIFGESTTNPGIAVGTVFDDNATRDIFDPTTTGTNGVSAPAVGHYRPELGSLDSFIQQVARDGDLNGTWTLEITDFRTESTPGFLQYFSLQFTTGMSRGTPTTLSDVANVNGLSEVVDPLGGAISDTYSAFTTPATPNGVGPGLSMAIDNTLGNSPYAGRIYAVFTGWLDLANPLNNYNPVGNTDIFMSYYPYDGRNQWSPPVEVNTADAAIVTGNSQENTNLSPDDQPTGRSQFQPEVAVDPTTGSVVFSWRDASNDAANTRVATYITYSVDGGQNFAPLTYANPSQTAIDAITGQTDVMGPMGDNQGGGNGQRDSGFGYGDQMGLAVSGGHLYPIWAGNLNRSYYNGSGIVAFPLNIWYRPMVIPAGPQIVASTMGPVPISQESTFAAGDVAISVTFDRPVSPSSVSAADVQVFYHDTTNGHPFKSLDVTSFAPTGGGTAPTTQYTILFNPNDLSNGSASGITNYTGTYSYLVAPDNGNGTIISAPIWSYPNGVLRPYDPDDQNANGTPDQNAVTGPVTDTTPGDVYAVPAPQVPPNSQTVTYNGAASILSPPFGFNANTLPLIYSGPQVAGTQAVGTSGQLSTSSDDLLVNDTTSQYTVTFDRPMQVSTFTPSQVLSIVGPVGPVTGPQTFTPTAVGQTIPAAATTGPGVLSAPLTIPSYGGTFKIADITVNLSLAFSSDASLSAVLIAPDGTQVPLFSNVGGTSGANFVNTTLDDAAENSITTGTAPFTGTFKPTGTLANLDGHTVDIRNAAGTWIPGVWTLQISNSKTGATGTLDSWSLNITPVISVTPVSPANGLATQFTIGFPQQELSGTYTVQLGPNILDQFGDPMDTVGQAGLDVLRGQSQNGPVTPVNYSSSDLPKPIPAASGTTPGMVTSTITVPDSFMVQGDSTSAGVSGLRVQVNLTYPNDPALTATLSHYDASGNLLATIPLFSNVGSGVNTANFTNTVFDDNAPTPIQEGRAPFFATFDPQMPLSTFAGMNVQGTWVLTIQNNSTTGGSGTAFTGWTLSFEKPLPTTGLGVPGMDNASLSFRLFTLGQADAMSAQAWTPVGPSAIGSGGSSGAEGSTQGAAGRVTGLAIDPSDPSGNTVYAAGASGGVWKTTDFLTTNPEGPTWIPLTDFGPSDAVNIGGITVFARNHDPNQSIIIAATGEGNTGTPGVGFLISTNGGQTWTLDDSSVNVDASGNPLPIESTARDRTFVGDTAYQVTVDPTLSTYGGVIIYAAMSGPTGGIWRSENSGQTWVNMLPGQATSVVLDPDSGTILDPTTGTNVQGNLQVVYAGIRGVGVEMSPNQGQVWNLMAGGVGNPEIVDNFPVNRPNVNPAASPTPNGAEGRIVLAVPNATGNSAEDPIYEGWLYAAVAGPDGSFVGLFVTKDFGANWTEIHIPTLAPIGPTDQAIPNNNVSNPNYSITGSVQFPQGNYNLILAVDPTDPSIVYLGGSRDGNQTGLIRVDTTTLWDAHSLVAFSDVNTDGALDLNSTGPATVDNNQFSPVFEPFGVGSFGTTTSYLNFIRNPDAPFTIGSELDVANYSSFTNNGNGVEWIPFDMPGTDYHAVTTMVDPVTGLPRLIFGNDQGIWSVLDDNGTFENQVGSDIQAGINRNGNLQITQFYYGAVQPSSAAAQVAGALFYGSAQDNGGPVSTPNVLTTGNITWNGPGGDAAGVGTDQQGSGLAYQYFWPCCGPQFTDYTDFFQLIPAGASGDGAAYIGETNGLLQASGGLPTPDPQWPFKGGANFAVNPVNSSDVVISSSTGNIFATSDQGQNWFDIGPASNFGSPGSFSLALAYGAPDPSAPEGVGNLGNFIYVGTQTGQIYVTQDGGGTGTSNNWINISTGLDHSPVEDIITDPTRGSHDAYAVTTTGVFYIANSIPSASNPTPTWVNITGSLHNLIYSIFGQSYNPTTDPNAVKLNQGQNAISAIVADWRYVIPDNPANPSAGYHPVLYVSVGNSGGLGSGVYQSLDNGQTWTLFPSTTFGAVAQGGDLPHVPVTDLNVSLGNVDVNTGMPSLAGPYQAFVFTGTLTSGSATVTGISTTKGLAVGELVTGTGIPAGTTIQSINTVNLSLTLSANATASGSETLSANNPTATPDPDLLLATTYGQGQYAINLGPLVFGPTGPTSSVSIGTANISGADSSGNPIVTGPITFSGQSEISGFGDTTWISIVDETPGDATYGKVIGGFNPSQPVPIPGAGNSTNSVGHFAVPFDPASAFTTNGIKTVELYATDDAGSVGNKVTITFDLNDSNLPQPPPTTPPSFTQNLQISPSAVRGTINGVPVTNQTTPPFLGTASPGTTLTVYEFQLVNGSYVAYGTPFVLPASDINSSGAFTFPFANPDNLELGTFQVYVTAYYTRYPNIPGEPVQSNTVTFEINNQTPAAVTNLHLNPADDSGIVGDNVTDVRLPHFIGTTSPGNTVELFQVGSSVVQSTATADSSGNFSIQLPYVLTNGQITVDVKVVNPAGNSSTVSNPVTIAIVSTPADYNGGNDSNAALYRRATTINQGLFVVQTQTVYSGTTAPPPWFGPNGNPASWGTSSEIPLAGDFDGDGYTDLAVYDPATATWAINESGRGISTFVLGTPNLSIPVVGNFDANGPDEPAVVTVNAQNQEIWTIASAITGNRTVDWGVAGDIPVPGDYDGLGYDEVAVYRPSNGEFYVLNPVTNQLETFNLGLGSSPDLSSLVPVPGGYDNLTYYNNSTLKGQNVPIFGHTEAAVFDPRTGVYTILGPSGVYTVSGFQPGDIPAPGDYAGNGTTQAVVFRPSTGQFLTSNGTVIATIGRSGDVPLTSPLSYRTAGDPPSGGTTTGGGTATGGATTGGGTTGGGTTGGGTTGGGTTTGGTTTGGTATGGGTSSGGSTSGVTTPGSGSSGSTGSTSPSQPTSLPGTSPHIFKKKKVTKKASEHKKPVVHHKPAPYVTRKAAHAIKPKAHGAAAEPHHAHVVDLALQDVHVNLLRSNRKPHHN